LKTFSFTALFIFSIAISVFGYYFRKRDRHRIHAALKENHCEPLHIVWLSQYPKTPNMVIYEVTFVNTHNELFRAKCFLPYFGKLTWSEPVFMYSVNMWQLAQLKQSGRPIPDQMPFKAKSDKKTIIDGLTSHFKHERIWAAEQLLELEIVDWEMRRLLNDLATGDEEPEVREAATRIIKKLQIIDEG
jgi:hypothetical protein